MVFRLKVRFGRHFAPRQLASKAAALLTPAAVCALILACWRLGADLGWTGEFAISAGLFSHWQVWMVAAAALQVGASVLNGWANRNQQRAARPAGPAPRPQPVRRTDSAGTGRVPKAGIPASAGRAGTIAGRPYPVRPVRRTPETYPVKDRTYF